MTAGDINREYFIDYVSVNLQQCNEDMPYNLDVRLLCSDVVEVYGIAQQYLRSTLVEWLTYLATAVDATRALSDCRVFCKSMLMALFNMQSYEGSICATRSILRSMAGSRSYIA